MGDVDLCAGGLGQLMRSFLGSAHVGVQLVPVTVHEKHSCCWQENFQLCSSLNLFLLFINIYF